MGDDGMVGGTRWPLPLPPRTDGSDGLDHPDSRTQPFQRRIEIDLIVVLGTDARQPWRLLAMPATRPADRVHDGIVCGVAADQRGGQRPRLVQHGKLFRSGRRHFQPPMQMQLRLDLAGLVVDPLAAALDHDGGRSEQGFEGGAGP
jgi:hypothetical protein